MKSPGSGAAQEAAREKIGFEIHAEQNDKFAESIIAQKAYLTPIKLNCTKLFEAPLGMTYAASVNIPILE
jgi:hypothetical protein